MVHSFAWVGAAAAMLVGDFCAEKVSRTGDSTFRPRASALRLESTAGSVFS